MSESARSILKHLYKEGRMTEEQYKKIDRNLKERPQGEWIDKGEYAECSLCGSCSGTQFDGVEPIPLKTNFCPNCGADMRGGEAE